MRTVSKAQHATLKLRIQPEVLHLVERAAQLQGKSCADFILDAAHAEAEDVLLDQVHISVSLQAFKLFQERLDMPPKPNERLKKTMAALGPNKRHQL